MHGKILAMIPLLSSYAQRLCVGAGCVLCDSIFVFVSTSQLKHTSEFVHSPSFMDLTNQIARNTSRTGVEAEECERSLKKMVARFNQIENEKDRERRLVTQRK